MEQPDALILTGIGFGAAFGVLVMLLIAVLIIGRASRLFDKEEPQTVPTDQEPPDDPEAANRATAAAVAVTALLESRPYLRQQSSQDS